MSDLRELYQQVIIDHNKNPRNFHSLDPFSHTAEGYNPLCGDRMTLWLEIEDGIGKDVGFQVAGCAISQASASMFTQAIKGRPVEEVEELSRKFQALITGETDEIEELGKLKIFIGVRDFPSRVKCATLSAHTILAALNNESTVTTE